MATRKSTGAATAAPRARGAAAAARPEPGAKLGKRELAAYHKRLKAELDKLTGQLVELEEAASLATETAGQGGVDEEWADLGASTFERERDMSLVGNLKDLADQVERALARIDDGSFGRCQVCGNPIEAERLEALPYATLCLADARRQLRPR